MFKKVRKKFIISAMSSTFVVTLALIISINLINYMQVTGNLKAVMESPMAVVRLIRPTFTEKCATLQRCSMPVDISQSL